MCCGGRHITCGVRDLLQKWNRNDLWRDYYLCQYEAVIRDAIKDIGHDDPEKGDDYKSWNEIVAIYHRLINLSTR